MAGIVSPDVANLAVGKGFILFKPDDAADFYHVGNVPTFTFTPKITTLDHFSSMEGTRLKDLSITLEKSGEVKMDMEELTARNLAMLVLGDVTIDEDGNPTVSIFSRDSLTGQLQYYATNEVGPRWYVDLLSVTFNPSGDFSPIGDTFAKLPVTGTVQAVDGVFGTMVLKPPVGSSIPENVLPPFISGATGTAGAPVVGDVLSASIGGWIGVSSYAYTWEAGGAAAGGTPNNTKNYTPVAGDVGKALTVSIIGTNSIGASTPVESDPTPNVAAT
jgi:hypothetical protein